MKSKNILWMLVGAVVIVGGYYGYKKFFGWTKEKAAKYIKSVRGDESASVEELMKMDTEYLIQRAKAMKDNLATFEYEGKTYDTKTGTAKI